MKSRGAVIAVFLLTAATCYCAEGPLIGRHEVFDLIDRDLPWIRMRRPQVNDS